MFSIFKSKQKREAEALAKLKEDERKKSLARSIPPQRNPSNSSDDTWGFPAAALYPSNYNISAREVESPSNFLSEGSGSFSGAGSSSSWSSSSSDDSSSRSCSSSSYSSSYSSSDSYSSSSSDSSSSCSSSD